MKAGEFFVLTSVVALPLILQAQGSRQSEPDDSQVIELAPFVVYEGLIDVIDGFTGEPYNESNAVVDGFRESFNKILLWYHREILRKEYEFINAHIRYEVDYVRDLNALSDTFNIPEFDFDKDNSMKRERAIFSRLMKDPFFKIEALVVWDLDRLRRGSRGAPDTELGQNIRLNEETGQWERRVLTEWKAVVYNKWAREIVITKKQGLNLETNKGFHFVDHGLTEFVNRDSFRDVELTYPIFVTAEEPVFEQIEKLKAEFLKNLFHLYDPFSWAWRRNWRYRGGFSGPLQKQIWLARFKIEDRKWFDQVLANFLNDIITIKYNGSGEIYDFAMLSKVKVNGNILGEGLDLLNWHEGENRSVGYNPNARPHCPVDFNEPDGARFILLDAYRRYPDRFLNLFRERLLALKERVPAKEFIRDVLAEVSGVPADVYIEKATEAQLAELAKFRYQP